MRLNFFKYFATVQKFSTKIDNSGVKVQCVPGQIWFPNLHAFWRIGAGKYQSTWNSIPCLRHSVSSTTTIIFFLLRNRGDNRLIPIRFAITDLNPDLVYQLATLHLGWCSHLHTQQEMYRVKIHLRNSYEAVSHVQHSKYAYQELIEIKSWPGIRG